MTTDRLTPEQRHPRPWAVYVYAIGDAAVVKDANGEKLPGLDRIPTNTARLIVTDSERNGYAEDIAEPLSEAFDRLKADLAAERKRADALEAFARRHAGMCLAGDTPCRERIVDADSRRGVWCVACDAAAALAEEPTP